jgi:dipeptidyl-peptidase-4
MLRKIIFIYDLAAKSTTQITTDGKKTINGITDWVYEEEFAFVRAFDWSKDSKKLAYIRFDESQVPEFSMSMFNKDLYPTVETFKYPKAGEKNSLVSLHIMIRCCFKGDQRNQFKYNDFILPAWNGQMMQMSYQRRC